MDIEIVDKLEKEVSEIVIPDVPFVVDGKYGSIYLVTRHSETDEFVLTVLKSNHIGYSYYDEGVRDDDWMKENFRTGAYKILESKILIEKSK